MGGRGNNRNKPNSFYNSSNNGGRNASYDNRSPPMSQPTHSSQPPSSYSLGRGNGNFQHRPYWQNSYTNTVGYPRPPPWMHPNSNPVWGRNNYRPQHPQSWEHTQQHRFPNQQKGSWNSGAPPILPPPPPPPPMPHSNPTFRFGQVPLGVPPQQPPVAGLIANSSHYEEPCTTAPRKDSLTTSVTTPLLGSKEDRELRLEVAKTLVKRSLQESRGEENEKTSCPTGQLKKKCPKPKSTKPNEGDSNHIISLPVDRVNDNQSCKPSSSVPGSDEQRKRRLSLESNCVLSTDTSKSASKPVTPKRNRSSSLSLSSIPKTTELSTPSEAQNIKQRIIHELLGMSKNTLKEIISNPRSRKFEHVMKHMMKESRWKQSQIQRQAAQAGIDSPFENQNCELVQRDYEDLLSDPDLAINLSNLPSEMIETLGNIFNLGAISEEPNNTSEGIDLDANEISCLFDSNSPSYTKLIPCVDLSSPVTICLEGRGVAGDEEPLDDCATISIYSDQDLQSDRNSIISDMDSMRTDELSLLCKPLGPTTDYHMNKSTTLSPLADGLEKQLPSKDSSVMIHQLSRPEKGNSSLPLSQKEREPIEETSINELNYSKTVLGIQNFPLEEKNCAPSILASDLSNTADKYKELPTPPVEDEASLINKDPMFSTQSDSPTIAEELTTCSSLSKKDSENNLDTEDQDNNQLESNEPLLSLDPFSAVNINNNDMMAMKTITTVEPEESVTLFKASEHTGQSTNQVTPANSEDHQSTSSPQDFKCVPNERLDVSCVENVSNNEPTTCAVGSLQIKSISEINKVIELETTPDDLVSIQLSSFAENPKVLEMQRDEETDMEIQEPNISPKILSSTEIGIQTDFTTDDSRSVFNANDLNSIVKLLESSSLPGIDHVKKILNQSLSKPSVFTDKNYSFTPVDPENLGKLISEAGGDVDLFQSSLLTLPMNPRGSAEVTPRTIPVAISKPVLSEPSRAVTNKQSRSKLQRCAAVKDSARPSNSEGTLKNLQNQIKGLEPKDKLKYVFLKITDIEKKIAEWADIKKELYQLVSYILEDEKSQSASSSHEESATSEREPETNKSLKKPATKNSLPRRPLGRPCRSNTSSVPELVETISECGSSSTSTSKNSPRSRRKRVLLTTRKKKKIVDNNTPNPVLSAKKDTSVTHGGTSLGPRSLARIKIESSSDNEDFPAVCPSLEERSRASKRNKPPVNVLSDSSSASGPAKKRACTRQSSNNTASLTTQTNTSSPLRKTKAELKQMVFFPKPPEKSTRQASVSNTLGEDVELRVTRRGRNTVVKEGITEPKTELNKSKVTHPKQSVPLRDCSVVIEPLKQYPLRSKQTSIADESAVDSQSQSQTSSDDDDELPLSLLNRKGNLSSPSASLQGDIDISSVSSSDTISLKINIACPKSMKSKMIKYADEPDESLLHHHHSSRRGPLVFAQHNQGTILDIKVVGKHVLTAGEDGLVLSYSVKSGKLKKKYRGHSAAVTCICIINCESEPYYPEKMVTGSTDGQVRYFILKTAEQMHAPLQVGETTAIDSDWGVIYLGSKGGEIVQVNTKTFTSIGEIFQCSQEPIHALKATKEGPRKVLIVGSRNQAITIRDAETGLLLRSVSGGWQQTVYSLLLDNSLVYCGTKEGNVRAFDFTNGQQMFCLQAGNGVRCLKVYNGLLFAGCYDGFIYVFKGQTLVTKFAGGKMIISMDFTKNKVIFSSKDMLQALHFPYEVSLLLKEMKMKRVQ